MFPLWIIDPIRDFEPVRHWAFFPALFIILSVILVITLTVLLPWRQYEFKGFAWLHTCGGFALFIGSLSGSVWCYYHHVCMCGHGVHGITILGYVIDTCWVLGLLASSAWLARERSILTIPIAYIAGFILSYRFIFGSMGGLFPSIPL
jgi:hypothetical protein